MDGPTGLTITVITLLYASPPLDRETVPCTFGAALIQRDTRRMFLTHNPFMQLDITLKGFFSSIPSRNPFYGTLFMEPCESVRTPGQITVEPDRNVLMEAQSSHWSAERLASACILYPQSFYAAEYLARRDFNAQQYSRSELGLELETVPLPGNRTRCHGVTLSCFTPVLSLGSILEGGELQGHGGHLRLASLQTCKGNFKEPTQPIP